jgi:hypothetical protein
MCGLALRGIRIIIVALCFECRLSLLSGVAELQAKLLPGFARCVRVFAKLMGATGLGDSLSRENESFGFNDLARFAKSRSLKPFMSCMYGSNNGQASGKTLTSLASTIPPKRGT